MMESPVSAFVAYSEKKDKNHKKKKLNRNRKQAVKLITAQNTQQKVPNEFIAKETSGKIKQAREVIPARNIQPKIPIPNEVIVKIASKLKKQSKSKKNSVKNKVQKPVIKKKKQQKVLQIQKVQKKFEEEIEVPVLTSKDNTINGDAKFADLYEETESNSSSNDIEFEPVKTDSSEEGLKVFEWLIHPFSSMEFLNKIWEKKPLHISRNNKNYYKNIISTPIIDNMLRKENIQFTKNIDITSYANEKRETHNPIGRAHPHVVWDYYLNGCSIRLLNPQTYIPKLHLLNVTLQEFFNTFVGANAYLTPPDSQGFAPHYDDIEAAIMQIEGKKQWRIYKPISENETLPRVSSKNFDQDEIGDPIMEVTLEAGDMLYFPRGFIHQGVTIDSEHSLHITISFYQKHSWADLFEKLLPMALDTAIRDNVQLRKGLPFDLYEHFGLVNSDINSPRKEEIVQLMKSLFDKIGENLPIDAAVDEISKEYQHTALPPVLSDKERVNTVYGDSDIMAENGKVINRVEIELDTRIRLLRRNILRMVMENDVIRVYYYTENSLEYKGYEPQFLEMDETFAPAIENLIRAYPEYISVESLDILDEANKIQIANDLWEKGLIMTEYPLPTIED